MEDTNRVYRIRTAVGEDAPNVIHVPLNQSYDMFEILSLKLNQTNAYKTYESDYGVIVGRVAANGGFGVPNAKVSIFINVGDDDSLKSRLLYNFSSVSSTDNDGVRYNLLPDYVDDACHQDVGTFPNKRLVLDNKDEIEIFDKYWKYTTTTNHAGDYMLFGIPTGSQELHVDVDLSDCGILSQRPRDMIGKGYNANMFESPNKFKTSTNLNSLAQIISQDRGIYVYPYWGDVSETPDKFAITRCDINLEYKFESYAVFIGSIVTDKGSNAIGKNCTGTEQNGKMSDLIAGEGSIEMIRKTLDDKVEEFPIMGNRLIDGDGVWCYQIPMNLDYVTTDEFGNLVPTDNPEKGIATRARVRFRISLDENPNDATARKRARYLVPNNPRIGDKGFVDSKMVPDYEFGTATREESFCDLFWNKVYSVKNYIPKLQKNSKETNRKHTGIKLINHYGDNNPMPYNALTIKLSFTYRLICVIVTIFVLLVGFLNNLISILGAIPCWLADVQIPIIKKRPFKGVMKYVPSCIALSSEFCDDGINPNIYYPGCGKPFSCVWSRKTLPECQEEQAGEAKEDQKRCVNSSHDLRTCIENELAQQNDATSFNFYNDWVNGVLYAPLWYRKITPKKSFFFGLFRRSAKDEWCSANKYFDSLRIMQACSVIRDKEGAEYQNFVGNKVKPYYHESDITEECDDGECNKSITNVTGMYGVILPKETMLGQTAYYYKPVEYDPSLKQNEYLDVPNKPQGEIKLLFATDIILLGSLNDCDLNGVPQFFKSLESTTYNLPSDILFTDHEIVNQFDENGNFVVAEYTETSEMAGCDWGNNNEYGKPDGGLFYSIGCSDITMEEKSCINLSRICEFGVSLDETKQVPKLDQIEDYGDDAFEDLVTDGFVSWDELYNFDERSMFATMNGNRLKTKLNTRNGLKEYEFRYLYPENFDGSLKHIMEERTKRYNSDVTYRHNYKLEEFSRDYYIFRMGDTPYFYDENRAFARYENSFYFYFGLKAGKTAIEKFNSKYFAECTNGDSIESQIGVNYKPNNWCGDNDGYLALDFSKVSAPYDLLVNGVTDGAFSLQVDGITDEKIIFINDESSIPQTLNDYIQAKGIGNSGVYTYSDESTAVVIPMVENGSYQGVLTDADGNITEFNFNIKNERITFKVDTQNFKQPNNVLGDNYDAIASNTEGLVDENTKQVTRGIGGVITIHDVYLNGEKVDEYRAEIVPKKGLSGYNGSGFNNKGLHDASIISYDTSNEIYGVGLPKGDIIYTITLTQTCNGVDSDNVVKRDVYVSEPLPFKMYINDVDYDLIKNFNKIGNSYSDGWIPSGTIANRSAELQDTTNRSVIFQNNPWFNVDNVWSDAEFKKLSALLPIEDIDTNNQSEITNFINQVNSKSLNIVNLGEAVEKTIANPGEKWTDSEGVEHTATSDDIGRVVSDYVDYGTFTLQELIDEFTKVSVGGGVYYTWDGNYIVKDYDNETFSINPNEYNADNIYDLVNLVNGFIEKANAVIGLREELPSLVKNAFYLTCPTEKKNIIVSVQTSDMPYRTTLVYQQETAVENDDNENTLTTNNMTINYESIVEETNIPTITYACNEKFGIKGSLTYEPVVAQVNGYDKHPYYVGTTNDARLTIPKKTNGQHLDTKKKNEIWEIDESNQLSDLFDFPLIDKRLNMNFISWAFMDDIPYYKKILSYVNKEDYTQTITIEEYGLLTEDQKANYSPVYDRSTVTMNGSFAANVFNGNLTKNKFDEQTLCGLTLKLSENLIRNQQTYVEKRIILGYEGDEMLDGMIGFTKYIVDESYTDDVTQYAPMLPIQTEIALTDVNNCGISDTIYGNMRIELTENSVNNCITGEKILEVQAVNASSLVYYSVITLDNGAVYPLNYAEKNEDNIFKLNRVIRDNYAIGREYNLFSYKMVSDYFRDGDDRIVDERFDTVLQIQDSNGSIRRITSEGYGTTGYFTSGEYAPVYIVGETDNHCRAISPVYDYSYVGALIKFGILERKEVEITNGSSSEGDSDESSDEPTYTVLDPIKDYKFGIAVKKGHYYLDNYKYKLYGTCRLDSVNTIEVREETMNDSGQFLFSTITEVVYNILKSKFKSGLFTKVLLINDTQVTAVDYTGLKHICGISIDDLDNAETTWYTYIWNANMPKDEDKQEYQPSIENGGILYKDEYLGYIEFVYEKNETIDPMRCEMGEVLKYPFLGWTENKPDRNGPFVDFTGDNLIAKESKVYFGNWKTPLPMLIVHYYDYDGITSVCDDAEVEKGQQTSPCEEYENETWINMNTDEIAVFPYTVTEEISFKIFKYVVHFRENEETEEDMDTQYISPGGKVTPKEEYSQYGWYLFGDETKERIDFTEGYVVNEDTIFILLRLIGVKFYNYDDTLITEETIEEGKEVNVPEGYEGEVWINKDTEEVVDFPYEITEETNFKVKRYVVTFRNSSDTEDMDVQYVIPHSKVTPRGECADRSWYLSTDVNKEKIDFDVHTVENDEKLICFEKMIVHFRNYDNAPIADIEVEAGHTATAPSGYENEIWIDVTDSDNEVRVDDLSTYIINRETYLKLLRYTVYFENMDGEEIFSRQYVKEGGFAQSHEGEWYVGNVENVVDIATYPITQDTHFVQLIKYAIKWYSSINDVNPTVDNVIKGYPITPHQGNWVKKEGSDGNKVDFTGMTATGPMEFVKAYSISWYDTYDSTPTVIWYAGGESISARNGYNWCDIHDSLNTRPIIFPFNIDSDKSYVRIFNIKWYESINDTNPYEEWIKSGVIIGGRDGDWCIKEDPTHKKVIFGEMTATDDMNFIRLYTVKWYENEEDEPQEEIYVGGSHINGREGEWYEKGDEHREVVNFEDTYATKNWQFVKLVKYTVIWYRDE